VQAEEEEEEEEEEVEASESEKKVVEPEPKPEPGKRKQPQVRPWDIGKEGVKEGELLVLFSILASPCCCIFLLSCYLPEIIYNDCVTYLSIHSLFISFVTCLAIIYLIY
jgi:hypothetical protein